MSDPIRNVPPQQKVEFKITTADKGVIRLKVFDRIIVDDVYLHLVNQEIFRLISGRDPGMEVATSFKDFLVRERLIAR